MDELNKKIEGEVPSEEMIETTEIIAKEAYPAAESETTAEAGSATEAEIASEDAVVEASEKPLWSFSAQAASDRAAAKSQGRRGALVYAVIMTCLFAVCFAILALLLITGWGSEGDDRGQIGTVGSYDVADLVENVIDGVVTVYVQTGAGEGFGSGFVYSDDGYIITNYHVIDGARNITVLLHDGREVKAELIDGDELSDVAVIRVVGLGIPKLSVGDSDTLRVGESVVAIGTPVELEFAGTVTKGIVSGLDRIVRLYDDTGLLEKTMYLIQTDATLNHGNSGGPMFNMRGEVIGINTLKHLNMDTGDEIGFAIPINDVVEIAEDIIEDGEYSGGKGSATQGVQLGISCGTVVKDNKVTLEDGTELIPGESGVIVSGINDDSVCKDVLKLYDIIVSFDGEKTPTIEILRAELYRHSVGETVTLEVFRDGQLIKVQITL